MATISFKGYKKFLLHALALKNLRGRKKIERVLLASLTLRCIEFD